MTTTQIPYRSTYTGMRVRPHAHEEAAPEVGPQNLASILENSPYLPPQASILGVATDGSPILLNLMDASPTSLLIASDRGMGKTAMLKTMLQSAIALNSPDEVQAVILANDPAEWDDVVKTTSSSYFIEVAGTYERRAGELVMKMASRAEQRSVGRQIGATILVLIDNLKNIINQDYDAVLNFEYLLEHGAYNQVWPIVSMSSNTIEQVTPWVHRFRTRILGGIDHLETSRKLSGSPNPPQIRQKMKFATRLGQQWRQFWVPF